MAIILKTFWYLAIMDRNFAVTNHNKWLRAKLGNVKIRKIQYYTSHTWRKIKKTYVLYVLYSSPLLFAVYLRPFLYNLIVLSVKYLYIGFLFSQIECSYSSYPIYVNLILRMGLNQILHSCIFFRFCYPCLLLICT